MYVHRLGGVLGDLERYDEAESALLEAEILYRELGNHIGLGDTLYDRADLALDQGDLALAARLYQETRDLDRLHGVPTAPASACLAGLASVLAELGRDAEAATIWGAICAAEATAGFRMLHWVRRRYEKRLTHLENTEGWLAGRELTLEEAEELATPALAELR